MGAETPKKKLERNKMSSIIRRNKKKVVIVSYNANASFRLWLVL